MQAVTKAAVTVGEDYIGKFDLVFPLKFRDPIGEVHAPVDPPTVDSSDPSVATGSVYNLMLMVKLLARGTTEISVEYPNPAGHGRKLRAVVTLTIGDAQPSEVDIDVDNMDVQPVAQ